ncbi:MAG: VWD domain-containing protein [Ilumatobacteraceae bacterium]
MVSHEFREGEDWELQVTGEGAGRLLTSPAFGEFAGEIEDIPVEVTIDCSDIVVGHLTGTAELVLLSSGTERATIPVHWLCGQAQIGSGFTVVPSHVVLNESFTIFSNSETPFEWGAREYLTKYSLFGCAQVTFIGNCLTVPFGVEPSGGTLDPGPSSITVRTIHPIEQIPVCGDPGPGGVVYFGDLLINNGAEKVRIGWPPGQYVPKDDCGCDEGEKCCAEGASCCTSCGDPHVVSLDGLRYDAQVRGEYVYAESIVDDARIVARHERTAPNNEGAFRPTSVTALAVEVGETVVEMYARPEGGGGPVLRIDGEVVDLESTPTIAAGDGMLLRRSQAGGRAVWIVETPRFDVHLTVASPLDLDNNRHLNVSVRTDRTGTLRGLIGSDDDDPTNDLTFADGVTTITHEQALAHDTDLYAFTDSWRLTDPADSPFSQTYGGFDAANEPQPGSEALAPCRDEAIALLGSLGAICSGDVSVGDYAVGVLAIELAIGVSRPTARPYLCSYRVVGSVYSSIPDAGAAGIEGAEIVVDAVGLQPCVAYADANGGYGCELVPDIDEIGDGSGIEFPLPYTISVTPPGGDTPAVVETGAFPEIATFGVCNTVEHMIGLDIGDVTIVALEGVVSAFGEPEPGATWFDVTYRDTGGTDIGGTITRLTAGADGAYTAAFAVPADADEVDVVWKRGLPGDPYPTLTLTQPATGLNVHTFDPSYDPPVAVVSGEALINGVVPATVLVSADATRTDDSTRTSPEVSAPVDPVTGLFSAEVVLPIGTATADARARVPGEALTLRSTALDTPIEPGPNPVTVDLVIDRPVLDLSGTVTENGVPFPGRVDVIVDATTPEGPDQVTASPVAGPDGAYAVELVMPEGSTAADVAIEAGGIEAVAVASYPSLTPGTRTETLDVAIERPVLAISGQVVDNGVPQPGGFQVWVAAPPSFGSTFDVTADAAGDYSIEVRLPPGATTAAVDVFYPDVSGSAASTTLAGLTAATRAVTLDVDITRSTLDISGVVTSNGEPRPGEFDLVVTPDGGAPETFTPTADAAGAYTQQVVLEPGVTAADLEAFVEGFVDAVATASLTELEPGVNDIDFDVAVSQVVSIALSGEFTVGTDPYTDETTVRYRAYDGSDQPIGPAVDVVVQPDLAGTWSASFDLDPDTRRLDVAWVATDGPAFTSFAVTPGDNPLTFDVSTTAVTVELSGTLTEDTVGYADPTSLRLFGRDANGGLVETVDVDVAPDANGDYAATAELDPHVRSVEVTWPFSPNAIPQTFAVTNGTTSVEYDANYEVGPPVLAVSGTITVGGEPRPVEPVVQVTYRRSSGGYIDSYAVELDSFDPSTGAYTFTDDVPSNGRRAEVGLRVGQTYQQQLVDPLAVEGTTPAVIDLSISGRSVVLDGVLTRGTDPAVDPVTMYLDDFGAAADGVVEVTPGAGGAFRVGFITGTDIDEAVVALRDGRYDSDTRHPGAPIALVDGINEVTGLTYDVEPPIFVVSGRLTTAGVAITDPVAFEVSWVRPEPDLDGDCCWLDEVDVTPDGNGDYSFTVEGPMSALSATVVADLAAVLADRSAEIAPVVPGELAIPITVDAGTGTLTVTGTAFDGDEPFPYYNDYVVTATLLDGSGQSLGSFERLLTPESDTGAYTFEVPVAVGTASVAIAADMNVSYFPDSRREFLVFDHVAAIADDEGANNTVFDIVAPVVTITGVVETDDGTLRVDESWGWTIVASSGGTAGTVLATLDGYTYQYGSANYEVESNLPPGTDTIRFQPALAGVDPITFTGLGAGGNDRAAAIVTDDLLPVEVTGAITLAGERPSSWDITINGYADGADGRLTQVWSDYPSVTLGANGEIDLDLLVGPEAEILGSRSSSTATEASAATCGCST